MRVRILGSAAGGGFPQWNCNCTNCYGIRNGKIKAQARTQSSIAVSVDNERWILFNASPDVRAQLEGFSAMQPRGLRGTGIQGIVLVDSHIEHTAGLLMLREGYPLRLYVTDRVAEDLSTGFRVLEMLKSSEDGADCPRISVDGESFSVDGIDRLRLTAVALNGKAPSYSSHRCTPHPGDKIGIFIEDRQDGSSLFYAPTLACIDDAVLSVMARSDCVLVDGTFWEQDEMIVAGVGAQLAGEMGHLPLSGEGGIIEKLRGLPGQRKVLIHMNNTNPILVEDSPQRGVLEREGIEVAYDGMEINLGEHATGSRELGSAVLGGNLGHPRAFPTLDSVAQ